MKGEGLNVLRFFFAKGKGSSVGKTSSTPTSSAERDYRIIRLSLRDRIQFLGEGLAVTAVLAWLFYRTPYAVILLLPAAAVWYRYRKKTRKDKLVRELSGQFKNALQSLASSLAAGYSPENSFAQAAEELTTLYGQDSMIVREFRLIGRKAGMSEPVEEALSDLAERSGLADIRQLAVVFAQAKRSGGRLVAILEDTAETMRSRLALREEILTLITAKKLEARIMILMPPAILLYLNLTGGDFLTPLYSTAAGRAIMSGCLVLYAAAALLSERIMRVEC